MFRNIWKISGKSLIQYKGYQTKVIVTKLILSVNKSTIESITEQKIIYSNRIERKSEQKEKLKINQIYMRAMNIKQIVNYI